MKEYIAGNKEAWEEAFEKRDASYGANFNERMETEPYAFFEKEMADVLKRIDTEGKSVGQFCSNNGRELLSLVKNGNAAKGTGFDIAENMVAFANEKAKELDIPCTFEAVNVYDIDDRYREQFDVVIITIGSLCWFDDLDRFFAVVSKCTKPGGQIVIHEQHPCTNMLAVEGEEEYDPRHPLDCIYSYFEHEWTGNEGMFYMTQKSYPSKTFTDFTHPLTEIIAGICDNGFVITDLKEFDHDISGMFSAIDHSGYPLSMIIRGKKTGENRR